jgi:hypothetical protein
MARPSATFARFVTRLGTADGAIFVRAFERARHDADLLRGERVGVSPHGVAQLAHRVTTRLPRHTVVSEPARDLGEGPRQRREVAFLGVLARPLVAAEPRGDVRGGFREQTAVFHRGDVHRFRERG